MTILAPSPSRPIGLDQRATKEGRLQAAHGLTLSTLRGPSAFRDDFGGAATEGGAPQTAWAHHAKYPPLPNFDSRTATFLPPAESSGPHPTTATQSPQAGAQKVWESATLPAVPKLGFFAAMKERLCRLTGLIHSPAEIAEDTAGEPEGFLATVESHLKRLSQVTTIAELSSWAMKAIELALTPPNPERPLLRGKARGKREKKGPHTEAPQYGNDLFTNLPDQQDSNPFREVERHSWDSGAPSVDLTVQALHVVAEATRAEQAKEKKRRHDSFQEDLRRKGTTRDTLKRSAGEGIRGVDAAPILRELDGVYGTVEVAERQFRELAERRKRSQG